MNLIHRVYIQVLSTPQKFLQRLCQVFESIKQWFLIYLWDHNPSFTRPYVYCFFYAYPCIILDTASSRFPPVSTGFLPLVWYISLKEWVCEWILLFFSDNEECEVQKIDWSPCKNRHIQRHLTLWQFRVPLTGQYKGGIIAGKRCEQDQGTSLGSFVPNFANSWSYKCFCHTGRMGTIRHNSGWTGCTKWVVLSEIHSGTPEDAVLRPPAEPSANDDLRPVPVFTLNKGVAKVTKCTKEQKDIMIAFYDRQKTSHIKANQQM